MVSDYEINEVKSILKLDSINYDNVVALSIADGSAMGDPGLVVILEKDLSECRFHYYKVDSDKLKQKLPFFSSIKLDYGKVRNVEKGWGGVLFLGLGIIMTMII